MNGLEEIRGTLWLVAAVAWIMDVGGALLVLRLRHTIPSAARRFARATSNTALAAVLLCLATATVASLYHGVMIFPAWFYLWIVFGFIAPVCVFLYALGRATRGELAPKPPLADTVPTPRRP